MEEGRSAFKILTGRPTGKRPLGRPRRRWEDNIRIYHKEMGIIIIIIIIIIIVIIENNYRCFSYTIDFECLTNRFKTPLQLIIMFFRMFC